MWKLDEMLIRKEFVGVQSLGRLEERIWDEGDGEDIAKGSRGLTGIVSAPDSQPYRYRDRKGGPLDEGGCGCDRDVQSVTDAGESV